jgi:LytS/YehU family sensor histidine kinase
MRNNKRFCVLLGQCHCRKKALQKKQLQSENALLVLKAQLNPHFLFNSLNNIDVLMEESAHRPMLFLPFVENAFKFSKNKAIEHGVQIRFEVQPESVRMLSKNRFEQATITVQKSEGLGIETIRKRLEWLYPKRYRLNIDASDGWFTVDLCIPLNHAH